MSYHAYLQPLSGHSYELFFDGVPNPKAGRVDPQLRVHVYMQDTGLDLGCFVVDVSCQSEGSSLLPNITSAIFEPNTPEDGVDIGYVEIKAGATNEKVRLYMRPEDWDDEGPSTWQDIPREHIGLAIEVYSSSNALLYSGLDTLSLQCVSDSSDKSSNQDSLPPGIDLASNAVDTELPLQGVGYSTKRQQSIERGQRVARESRSWGTLRFIRLVEEVGRRWAHRHPGGPRFFVGDIAKKGGGMIPPHKSHGDGLNGDVAVLRNDGREGYRTTNIERSTYSKGLTEELMQLFIEVGGRNIELYFFADRELKRSIPQIAYQKDHRFHFHIRLTDELVEGIAMTSRTDSAASPQ